MGIERRYSPCTFVCMLAGLLLCSVAAYAASERGEVARGALGKFLGAKPTEYPAWFKESFLEFSEDITEAADAGKRIMVLFHQDGCPYCNALVERNLAQKDIENILRKRFDVIAINMWGDRDVVTVAGEAYTEKTFAMALKIQFTPTILFFDENGQVVLRLNGYLPPSRFKLALEFVAGRRERQSSYHEYVATHQPPPSAGALNDQTFFSAPPYDLTTTANPHQRPIAVFFEQRQCPNCDTLHASTLVDPETRAIAEQFKCVQLDMWSDTPVVTPSGESTTARQWAKTMDIKYAPSIVLFTAQGKEIIRSEASFKTFTPSQSLTTYSPRPMRNNRTFSATSRGAPKRSADEAQTSTFGASANFSPRTETGRYF